MTLCTDSGNDNMALATLTDSGVTVSAVSMERKNFGIELRVRRLNESFRSNAAERIAQADVLTARRQALTLGIRSGARMTPGSQ